MGILSKESDLRNISANYSNQASSEQPEEKETDKSDEVSNYLNNNRGKISTINTSWQGLLDEDSKQPKRKTLLGE